MVYGQTGAGKTHTMHGNEGEPGIVPKALHQIFESVAAQDSRTKAPATFAVSFYEIYLEKIYDLLDTSKQNLRIRAHPSLGTFVEELTECSVSSAEEALLQFQLGTRNRTTSSTKMNIDSSRSHAIFCIKMVSHAEDDAVTRCSLMLVDLAGSESGADSGLQLDQQRKINLSLTSLGKVIFSLTDGANKASDCISSPGPDASISLSLGSDSAPVLSSERSERRLCYITKLSSPSAGSVSQSPSLSATPRHVPYRDSKLTRLLADALGGHSRTCLILCASSSLKYESETLSTLRFGQRAKLVKNDCVLQRFNATEPQPSTPTKTMQELYTRLDVLQSQLDESQSGKSSEAELAQARAYAEELLQQRDNLEQENQVLRSTVANKENADLAPHLELLASTKGQVQSLRGYYLRQLEGMEELIEDLRLQLQGVIAQQRCIESGSAQTAVAAAHEQVIVELENTKLQVEILSQRCSEKDNHIALLEARLKQWDQSL